MTENSISKAKINGIKLFSLSFFAEKPKIKYKTANLRAKSAHIVTKSAKLWYEKASERAQKM